MIKQTNSPQTETAPVTGLADATLSSNLDTNRDGVVDLGDVPQAQLAQRTTIAFTEGSRCATSPTEIPATERSESHPAHPLRFVGATGTEHAASLPHRINLKGEGEIERVRILKLDGTVVHRYGDAAEALIAKTAREQAA